MTERSREAHDNCSDFVQTSKATTVIRHMPIRKRIDWLMDYAHRHSAEFQSSESYQARSLYIAQHPTDVVALSCMDGRINTSVAVLRTRKKDGFTEAHNGRR